MSAFTGRLLRTGWQRLRDFDFWIGLLTQKGSKGSVERLIPGRQQNDRVMNTIPTLGFDQVRSAIAPIDTAQISLNFL